MGLKNILRNKYLLVAVYIIFISLVYFYVDSILKSDSISTTDKEPEENTAIEIKPVDVVLKIESPQLNKEYSLKKTNTDSVLDLLNILRSEKEFTYEKTAYIDRIEIDRVNDIYPPEGYKWKVFLKDEDITQIIADKYLEDNSTYVLKLSE